MSASATLRCSILAFHIDLQLLAFPSTIAHVTAGACPAFSVITRSTAVGMLDSIVGPSRQILGYGTVDGAVRGGNQGREGG